MKKIIIALLLISMVATSAYAVSIFDRALYKKVLLTCIRQYILVTRLTGEVRYIMNIYGKWVVVPDGVKNQYQSMYKAQTSRK